MINKTSEIYKLAYEALLKLIQENEVPLSHIELTDSEVALYHNFDLVFREFAHVKIFKSKTHLARNLKTNIRLHNLDRHVVKNSIDYHQDIYNFYWIMINFILLPKSLVIPIREQVITILNNKGIQKEGFEKYMRNRFTEKFSNLTFYEKILNARGFVHMTTNYSESHNSSINLFIKSLSRSKKVTSIVRNIRTYAICEYRTAEKTVKNKKSTYSPSEDAQLNFQRARRFVRAVEEMGHCSSNLNCSKIIHKLHPKIFYAPLDLNDSDVRNFSF